MPVISADAKRVEHSIRNHAVQFPVHFVSGHTLTENEARFAQRALSSTVLNSVNSWINRQVTALDEANKAKPVAEQRKNEDGTPYTFTAADLSGTDVQGQLDKSYAAYEIGAVQVSGVAHDPAMSLARQIAWERVKTLAAAKRIKPASIKGEMRAKLIADLLARDPSILEAAKATLASTSPTDGLDDMFAGFATDETPPAEVPASPKPAIVEGQTGTDGEPLTEAEVQGNADDSTNAAGDPSPEPGTAPAEAGTGETPPATDEAKSTGASASRTKNSGGAFA